MLIVPTLASLALALAANSPPATLILYRDEAEPILFKPALIIDGVEIGRLGQNRYLAVELAPGSHRVEARWPAVAGHRPAVLTVAVRPGEVGYVELTGTAAFWRTAAATALVKRSTLDGEAAVGACCRPAR